MKKQFSGVKTLDQIRAQCKRDGVEFDDAAYKRGGDSVLLRSPGVCIDINPHNGVFYGAVSGYPCFSSANPLDGEPWFDALREYFYVA